jgi:membrane-bound lytic murein transglycosylase B
MSITILRKSTYGLLASLLLGTSPIILADNDPAAERQAFVDEMVSKHGFDSAFVNDLLGKAEVKNKILEAIARPAEKRLNWTAYRKIFLIPKRIEGGVKFMQENREALDDAEKRYGIPPEIITAIIGVETLYGKHTGGYRVLDALSTLGFHYPPRGKFFRSELSHFLQLAREEKIDATEPTGSYAGAMGVPQFIPSSYRHYAIDFDGDGKRDIWNNNRDVIGSVANYFAMHGWRSGDPVTYRAENVTATHRDLIDAGLKPSMPVQQLLNAGITSDPAASPAMITSLLEFETDNDNEYWLGLHNFYVITRYNHSHMYAMAVYQLSREILKAMPAAPAAS